MKPIKRFVNENNEVTEEREFNADEMALFNSVAETQTLIDDKNKTLQASRLSAQAKLAALGLTADEVAAIVGN